MQHTISRSAGSAAAPALRERLAAFVVNIGRALRGPEPDLRDVRLTDQMERELANAEFREWTRGHWR